MSSSPALNLRVFFVIALLTAIGAVAYVVGWCGCDAEESSPCGGNVAAAESVPETLDGEPEHAAAATIPEAAADSPIAEWRVAIAAQLVIRC